VTTPAFALFETALGACAIAWSDAGISGLLLPEGNQDATRALARRRFEGADERQPPPPVADVVTNIRRLLDGEPRDLSRVSVDLTGVADFDRRVYDAITAVGPGETTTYGEIAARLGGPGLARAVGQSLGRNPIPIILPCHRVLASGGRTGGFTAPGGVSTKLRLLEIERARHVQPALPWDQGRRT
jgi:methylated-DNA-[protein]-cysteine S-methyltransferase